VNSYR